MESPSDPTPLPLILWSAASLIHSVQAILALLLLRAVRDSRATCFPALTVPSAGHAFPLNVHIAPTYCTFFTFAEYCSLGLPSLSSSCNPPSNVGCGFGP